MSASRLLSWICSKRPMTLFLVGYAGSGKSSLGKRLARRLGIRFVDTDKWIELNEGASVADIFHYGGEEYFRRTERNAVESLYLEGENMVVAPGSHRRRSAGRSHVHLRMRMSLLAISSKSPQSLS